MRGQGGGRCRRSVGDKSVSGGYILGMFGVLSIDSLRESLSERLVGLWVLVGGPRECLVFFMGELQAARLRLGVAALLALHKCAWFLVWCMRRVQTSVGL